MALLRSKQRTPTVLMALAAAGLLVGCGSSSSDPGVIYVPRAGDPVYDSVQVDGTVVEEATYRYYSVDSDGNLSATPVDAEESLPHVALLESTTTVPSSAGMLVKRTTLSVNTAMAFYKELWAVQRNIHPTYGSLDLAYEIGDLNGGIEELYADVQVSGLSATEYVAFYDAVEEAWPDNADIAGEARDFLGYVQMSPGELVEFLKGMGWTWRALVSKMVVEQTSFDDLYDRFESSEFSTFTDFLSSYLGGALAQRVNQSSAAAKGNPGLDVAKFAWDIIKDGRPVAEATGAVTRVLSSADDHWENYGNARRGETKVITWEGKNVFRMTLYKAVFRLGGYYGATNPGFGGKWLPSVAFTVDEAYAGWTWRINAGASILHAVNTGPADAPIPQIDVEAKLRTNSWFQAETKTFMFLANGDTGFSAK